MQRVTKKPENAAPPNRAREVLEDLLLEAELWAEMQAELERLRRRTPEEIEEDAKNPVFSDEQARQMLARAIEQVDARESLPAAPPERSIASIADEIEDLLDEAWVRRIGAMTAAEIKELAGGRSLTDEQAEAILRRATPSPSRARAPTSA